MKEPQGDLADSIEKILKDYHKDLVTDDLYETDEIRIRRRGAADSLKADDIVGIYSDSDFNDGKINATTIRSDIQNWIQKRGKRV